MSHFFVLHASTGPNDPIQPPAMSMALDDAGLRGRLPPKRKGKCSIFQKNPHLYVYLLTTMLTVATKMILQILSDSGIPRVAVEYRDPYTLPASHHIFFQINGIIKCDRNIKYSRAALGSNFEIRVVSDGPFSATSRCVHVRLLKFSSWIYRILFYWVNSYLYGESRRYLVSKNSPRFSHMTPMAICV